MKVDGCEQRAGHEFTFRPVDPDEWKGATFRIHFQSGRKVARTVYLRAGQRLLLAVRDPAILNPRVVPQTGHSSEIEAAAFTADGRYLATAGRAEIILWSVATGQKICTYPGKFHSLCFSPDGQRLLALEEHITSAAPAAVVWNVASGRKACEFRLRRKEWNDVEHPESDVVQAVFASGGRHVLSLHTGRDRTSMYRYGISQVVIRWDATTGREIRAFEIPSGGPCEAISPDGRMVLRAGTGSSQPTLRSLATGDESVTFDPPQGAYWTFSPDGRYVATSLSYGPDDAPCTTFVLDAATGKSMRTFKTDHRLSSGVFSPDGRMLIAFNGSRSDPAVVWNTATGDKICSIGEGIECAAFSPDGRYVVTASRYGGYCARLWDVATGRQLRAFEGSADDVSNIAFSPDGQKLLAVAWHSAVVRNTSTAARTSVFTAPHQLPGGLLSRSVFRPDDRHVVSSVVNGSILWDALTGRQVWPFPRDLGDSVQAFDYFVGFSPDGRRAITDGFMGGAINWDVAAGEGLKIPRKGKVLAANPRAWQVLLGCEHAGSDEPAAILWDVAGNELISSFAGLPACPDSGAFDPSGRQVLLVSKASAALFESATGKRLRTIMGLSGDVVFNARGDLVLTTTDHEAAIWSFSSGERLRTYANNVESGAFTPQGDRVLIVSCNGAVHLWDIATGQEVAHLHSIGQGEDWLVATREGLFDGSPGGRQKVTFRIGEQMSVVPVDRFFQDLYRPGLWDAIWRGERPMPSVEVGKNAPPEIHILSPDKDGEVTARQVTVRVEVVDRGGGIKGPWLFHNGARVAARPRSAQEGKILHKRFFLELVPGENRVEVRAASQDGSWESEPVERVLRLATSAVASQLFVLAVGVDRYAQSACNLECAVADARALADLFESRGPELYGKDKVHVVRLFDENATKAAIKQALQDAAERSNPQDTLVLFLSGHGQVVGQRYYFIPREFAYGPEGLEEAIRAHGLPSDELDDAVVAVRALKRVIIYDTCHAGAAIGPSRLSRDPFTFQKAVEQMSRDQGLFVIAAAPAGDVVHEAKRLGHGLLTYALLAAAGAAESGPLGNHALPARPNEKTVTVRGWFGFAQDNVPQLANRYFGKEQFIHFTGAGKDFPILPAHGE